MRGMAVVRPGATTGDIGAAIQEYAEAERCSVVRDFCGHGLGRLFHDEPNILHYGRRGEGVLLKPGMFFTIEPMINLGRPHVKILSDGWTAVTRDRSLSAQFEHSIGVTETGYETFTLSPKQACITRPMPPRNRGGGHDERPPKAPASRRIISATASGCASGSVRVAPMPWPNMNCSNSFCFAPCPGVTSSRSPNP